MKTIYKVFAGITAFLGAIAAFLFYQNKKLKEEAIVLDTEKKDAALAERQNNLEEKAKEIKDSLASSPEPKKAEELDDKAIEEYWNSGNKS